MNALKLATLNAEKIAVNHSPMASTHSLSETLTVNSSLGKDFFKLNHPKL
jgi:hypothetical protein